MLPRWMRKLITSSPEGRPLNVAGSRRGQGLVVDTQNRAVLKPVVS